MLLYDFQDMYPNVIEGKIVDQADTSTQLDIKQVPVSNLPGEPELITDEELPVFTPEHEAEAEALRKARLAKYSHQYFGG